MPRAQCQFYTAKLVQCSRRCDAGVDYCRTHQPKAVALGPRPAEGHCPCVRRVRGADQWCGRPNLAGQTLCVDHHNRLVVRIEEEERIRQRTQLEENTLNAYLAHNPQQPWAAVARHLRMRARTAPNNIIHLTMQSAYNVARRYFLRTTPQDMPVMVFNNFWQILWEEENGIQAEQVPPAGPDAADAAVQAYLAEVPQRTWEEVTADLTGRWMSPADDPRHLARDTAYSVALRYFIQVTPPDTDLLLLHMAWAQGWLARQPAAAPAPPMGQMGRLAADGQNVHTAAVSKQTNSNVDLLLEGEAYAGDTLAMLTTWWMVRGPKPSFESYWRVMEDIRHWYTKRTCKSTNDYLYQRVLNGLVAKVLLTTDGKDELHAELTKRLWEECEEAVGMCCEGHISRLANVLVGFDETFKPPVPVGEILQSKMAAISEMKLSHKLKLQKAVAVMDELKIPLADRAPWLEALEE